MASDRQTLAESVYLRVRQDLLSGAYEDGERINQVQLSRQLGVSRVPVREAVQRLIAEGLLTGDPFRRVEVTTVSTAEVAELLDIREQLEVMALRRWLESGRERSMQRAHDANDRFASEHDDSVRNQYDYQFHHELMAAMPVAAQMVRDIRSRTQKYIERVHIRSTPRPSGWEEHEAILRAIEQGQDSLAIELLQRHIDATRQLLLRAPEQTS